MPQQPLDIVVRHLHRLVVEDSSAEMSDRELLQRFAQKRDQTAFAQLVRRHGGMVLGVCRRVLRDPHAADDAFQATFWALARRPASIRKQASLGCWLHRVAYRVAQRARFAAARRKDHESRAAIRAEGDPHDDLSWREMCEVLDVELQALPEAFRAPLVLCYLEGMTRDEAAQQLGWSAGKVKGRLERGREMLRQRLGRRGITVSAALLGTFLTQSTSLALPGALVAETLRNAVPFALGQLAGLPSAIAVLAEGVFRAHLLCRLKTLALFLLFTCAAIGTGAWVFWQPPAVVETSETAEQPAQKAEEAKTAGSDRYGDPLPPHALARLGTVRFRHDWTLYASAVSPDGRIVAGGGNAKAQTWDAQTGRTLHHLPGHYNGVSALAFTLDSRLLASYGHDKKLRLTDVTSGKTVKELEIKDPAVSNSYAPSYLSFLPTSKTIVLKDGREPVVRLLDPDSGATIRAFQGEGQHLYDVAVSADGQLLAAAQDNGTVRVWEVATGKECLTIKKHTRTDTSLAFAPDGKTLATGGLEGTAYLWGIPGGKLIHTLHAQPEEITTTDPNGKKRVLRNVSLGVVRSLSFSPDGKSLVSSHPYSMVLWDPATGKEVRRFERGIDSAARFLPDGKTLLVGGTSISHANTLFFLDAITGQPCRRFDGHDSRVEALAYSADGKYVATAEEGSSGAVRVWEASSGRVIFQNSNAHRGRASALAFSPSGEVLAAGHGQDIDLWDLKNSKVLRKLPGHEHVHIALAFSPDGTKLASGGYDGIIRLWDLVGGKELQNFRVEKKTAWALAFSRDLRLAASGDQAESAIHVWDLATGKLWKTLQRGGGGGVRLAFSPDSRTLLEASGILWELASEQQRAAISLQGFAWSMAFAPDGRRIAVGGLGSRRGPQQDADFRVPIQLIDLADSRSSLTLLGHEGTVFAVSFSPDGRTLASASADTTAMLWNVAGLESPARPSPLTPEQRASCWADLAGGAKPAYSSMWKLAADDGTMDLLSKELRPSPAPAAAGDLSRLVADLDAGESAVRSRALVSLAEIGPADEEVLRATLAASPSATVRQSAESLLALIASLRLRGRRAVEILETMNTPRSRELLKTLAGGNADAWLTREAKESLDRMSP